MAIPEKKFDAVPDENGFFGPYGGRFVPPPLEAPLEELDATDEVPEAELVLVG